MPNQGENYASSLTIYEYDGDVDPETITDISQLIGLVNINPESITVDVIAPDGNPILQNQLATKDSTGNYHFNYQSTLNSGNLTFKWNVTLHDEQMIYDSIANLISVDTMTLSVLDLLKGWEITNPDDPEQKKRTVNTVTTDEIHRFITKAKIRASSYLNLRDITKLPTNTITDEAVATWAAGLLWNKYIRKVREGKEDSDPDNYGDKKVWEAMAMLKTYKKDNDSDNDDLSEEVIITSTYIS
ncbi:hypothetical protein [Methanobacterium sp.]|uniref:hypothetical protein n=1 Tax=Methanobacterium sp. TaxID=2164 RepID=UPI003C72D962